MMHNEAPVLIGRPQYPLKVSEIFKVAESEAEHPPELLITYVNGMQSHRAYAGEITLAMCRELKRSVEISCAVALRLAMKFPERNVLLFNTYAGADLLTSGFVQALHTLDLKIPYTLQRYLPKAKADDFDDTVDLPSPENLRVLDVPTSTLTPDSLREEITKNGANIVILNSFEFSAFTDRRRKELVETLLDARHRLGLTVFVFSHELRSVVPYTTGRGALGLLSAFSKSVWLLVEDWERRAWVHRLMDRMELKELGITN